MWKRWDAGWDELETVVEEIIDNGDKVVMAVRYRGRGPGSGVEVNDRVFEVHTFRDGQCVRKVDFRERSEAIEAAGLSE
jgi:ketosteroid isomerase-like protein